MTMYIPLTLVLIERVFYVFHFIARKHPRYRQKTPAISLENIRDIVRPIKERGYIEPNCKTTANENVLLLTYQLINIIPSFLGNEYVYLLMQNADYMLRIELLDQYGSSAYAHYTTFKINDESDGYRLTIGGYSGTAGNTLY